MRHILTPLPCTAQELENALRSYCNRNGTWDTNVGWQYDALRRSASLVLYRSCTSHAVATKEGATK